MVKPSKTSAEEGEISVSMVRFTMKGSDASLQKGLDTIKAALVQAGFAPTEARLVRTVPPPRQLSEGVQDATASGESEPGDPLETSEIFEGESEPIVASTARKPSAPRKPTTYKIIKDLKFDDVSPTLAEFVLEKAPATILDRYLCIAYWFKHMKGTEDLTIEHFYTAFMLYRWPPPKNPATPVHDLRKGRRQLLVNGASPGTSTITNAGEQQVMSMGKAAGA